MVVIGHVDTNLQLFSSVAHTLTYCYCFHVLYRIFSTTFCLWEYESVHVCGKVLQEELAIPTSEPELQWFMDGRCMATLLSLRAREMSVWSIR